ncbi:nitroreductase family protein [Streptomyces sp. NPDC051064]|uniref:nitroreductase family protein n=1 Tax=Streptomyces sp. NPDC051064 TaxID=3365641 RepID=UPI0037AB1849
MAEAGTARIGEEPPCRHRITLHRHRTLPTLPPKVPAHPPCPLRTFAGVLEDAQTAPSNSNTQPWTVHVVSGAARDALAKELILAEEEGRTSPDFTNGYGEGIYLERAQALGASHYRARGVERSDRDGRSAAVRENLDFYGAPHAAFLFMPALGDGVRTAGTSACTRRTSCSHWRPGDWPTSRPLDIPEGVTLLPIVDVQQGKAPQA